MIHLTGGDLTIEQVVAVARKGMPVAPLNDAVKERMWASQQWIEAAVKGGHTTVYGVNTGFGPLAATSIAPVETRQLSRNLILSCLAGVGDPIPLDWARAMMVIRANSLVKGFSGVRPVVVETLIEMLNRGVTPWIPSKGSLGASGDLAPLAHMAAVLTRNPSTLEEASAFKTGETENGGHSGQAYFEGELMSGAEAMARAGLERLVLEAKEGLALLNGTTFMAAAGALGVYDAERLLEQAELAAALSFEALLGITSALHQALHEVNGQPGQMKVAANLMKLLEGSQLVDSAPRKVQDAYSLRCIPQVLGPVRDTLAFLRARITGAINAASDNPLIFANVDGGRAVSGGNFHGQGPAMWLDFLGIAVAEIGVSSERRTFRLLDPALNDGSPAMLVPNGGLDSGMMVPQYTAVALVSDNKTLAHPDSVDSIPSSANQEDHVSMGANAARHALEIIANTQLFRPLCQLVHVFRPVSQGFGVKICAVGPSQGVGNGVYRLYSQRKLRPKGIVIRYTPGECIL